MKLKTITVLFLISFTNLFAQEHFGAISTSRRVGITNISNNPSELANLNSKFEVQLTSLSLNLSNNKVGSDDIVGGKDLKNLIFEDKKPVDFNIDSEIMGPGFAMRLAGFGLAVTTKANFKASLSNVDPSFGDAISNANSSPISGIINLTGRGNQRMNGVIWSELGVSVARKLYKTEKHQLNAGVTFKLLFPVGYVNIGVSDLKADIVNNAGNIELKNASGALNFAYAGSLANNFTQTSQFTKSFVGSPSGFSGDIGFDYQYKPEKDKFKLKVGAAIKNIGSLTFKGNSNSSKDYNLSIQGSQSLNLNQFANSTDIKDIENAAISSGYLTIKNSQNEFKVKLPTVLNLYADFKIVSKLSITAFMSKRLNENAGNDQIITQNTFAVTPRINLKMFEFFVPIVSNEISGITTGTGFRIGGFFMGSNSVITALTNNSKQVDFYTGFRFGFL